MPNGPGFVRSAKTQRNPLVTLANRANRRKMTRTMHIP